VSFSIVGDTTGVLDLGRLRRCGRRTAGLIETGSENARPSKHGIVCLGAVFGEDSCLMKASREL
jgi:hypothetical protein